MADEVGNYDEFKNLVLKLQIKGLPVKNEKDIYNLVENLEETVHEIKEELDDVYQKKKKADNEIHTLMLQDVENRKKISDLEDALRSHRTKESIYQTPTRKQSIDSQQMKDVIETLQDERDTLKKEVVVLEDNLGDMRNKLKTEKMNLLSQLDSIKEEMKELELRNTSLLDTAKPETIKLIEELKSSDIKMKEVVANCERAVKENRRLKVMNDDFKEEIQSLKDNQEVIMKQRDVECSLHLDRIDALKKEKVSLMDQLDEKVKELHNLKEGDSTDSSKLEKDYEQMTITNTYLKDDLSNARIQVDVLRDQRERLKQQVDGLLKEVESKDAIIKQNKQGTESHVSQPAEESSATYHNTLDITLTKVDVGAKEKKFGVKMISRPSRVVVTEVSEKQLVVQPGDYVMKINDKNVQHSEMQELQDLANAEYLSMAVVRPRQSLQRIHVKEQRKGLEAKTSLIVTKLSNGAARAGIKIGDEIVQINDTDVSALPHSKIEHKLSKSSVDLQIRRTQDQVELDSNPEDYVYERINDGYENSSKENFLKSRSRSQRSLDSSHSSISAYSATSSEVSHKESHYLADIRRRSTGLSECRPYVKESFRESVTSGDIVVTREGVDIRNAETDGSGDADVAREPKPRKSGRTEEEQYVSMAGLVEGGHGQSTEQHQRQTEHQLSTIQESSLSVTNGEVQSNSSGSLKVQDDDKLSQHSPVLGRPPHPLPAAPHSGQYSYVDRKFSSTRQFKEITLRKNAQIPSYGFTIFGGNKVGIYVDHVEKHLPADQEGLQEGCRIISMNEVDVTDAAFCLAAEYLKRLSNTASLKMLVVPMPAKDVATIRSKVPYDSFCVRVIKDIPPIPGYTLSIKMGDVLQIKDTYKDYDPHTGGYKWHAVKSLGDAVYSSVREGSVPAEHSALFKTDDYPEEFDNVNDVKRKNKISLPKPLRKKDPSKKIEENTVFPYGEIYEYLDDVRM